MKKRTIGVVSLGCPRNVVDTEGVLGRLKKKGYRVVDIEKADVALVNTCAFIAEAKRESIDVILDLIELKKAGKIGTIIVHGCLTQRYKEELRRELPEVDAFIGKLALTGGTEREAITPSHYAYLKICEGCVNQCSFCVIPRIKGGLRSLAQEDILKRVRSLRRQGITELNIVGQDITGYGLDAGGKFQLADLLKRILRDVPGIPWVRLLYLYPGRITDELLSVIRDSPRVCRYVDVPIQHCSDRILRLMNRSVSKAGIVGMLEKIRKRLPGVALRTSVIVGFPSETDKEFRELLAFLKEFECERLGAFMYSREEGTPAYSYQRQVAERTKRSRFDILMAQQQEISRRVNARFIGKRLEVLIDGKENGGYIGRTRFDAPEVDGSVYVESPRELSSGELVMVRITDTVEYDLTGVADTE